MIRNVQPHIESCSLCRREKLQTDRYQLQATETPLKPFAKVSIDLVVDLPTFHNLNKDILVMVDHLSGWPMTKAIPDKEATTVARAVYEKLILEHGSPEILLSDYGKEFANDTLAYVCEEVCIEQYFTSLYTPRSNGKTENFIKFLKASIRKLTSEDKAAWDQLLNQMFLLIGVAPTLPLVRRPTN